MLGHHWSPAEGKIVEVLGDPTTGRYGASSRSRHYYVVEVRTETGEVIRGNVAHQGSFRHEAGTILGVEVNAKTNEIRLSSAAKSGAVSGVDVSEQIRANAAAFDNQAGGFGSAGFASPNVRTFSSVRVVGPGGEDIALDGSMMAEMRQLTQSLMTGDPAARQAAIDRMHQIKAQIVGQAGTGAAGVGPVVIGGAHTVEARLAALQHLLDKGLLTESEFQAQRERIINEI
jgi:hypothetical protein